VGNVISITRNNDRFKSDMRMIAILEAKMNHLGENISRLEGIIEKFGDRKDVSAERAKIAKLSEKQDEINAHLYRVLSRYDVNYSGKGYFDVTTKDGKLTRRFHA